MHCNVARAWFFRIAFTNAANVDELAQNNGSLHNMTHPATRKSEFSASRLVGRDNVYLWGGSYWSRRNHERTSSFRHFQWKRTSSREALVCREFPIPFLSWRRLTRSFRKRIIRMRLAEREIDVRMSSIDSYLGQDKVGDYHNRYIDTRSGASRVMQRVRKIERRPACLLKFQLNC